VQCHPASTACPTGDTLPALDDDLAMPPLDLEAAAAPAEQFRGDQRRARAQ